MKKTDFDKRLMDDISASMGRLRAPEDLHDDVMARAGGGGKRRRGHAWPVSAVAALALVVVLATGGTAYAVAHSDFFQKAWGGHGMGDGWAKPADHDTRGLVPDSYSQDFTSAIGGEIPASFQDAVEDVGYVVECDGYKLTIGAVVVDDNGSGAATFTLTNPDGVDYNPEYGSPGMLVFGDDSELRMLVVKLADGTDMDAAPYYDRDSSTDTEIHGTVYFSAPATSSGEAVNLASGISWGLSFSVKADGDRAAQGHVYNNYDAYTEVFKPIKSLPARTFTDVEGDVLRVSPISAVFSIAKDSVGNREQEPYRLVLDLADGSEVVVIDNASGIGNAYAGTIINETTTAFVMTRLIDPDDIVSVQVTGFATAWNVDPDPDLAPLDVTLAPVE